eukprot:jgi/Mesvir1/5447/Mv15504-RA.1
MHSPKPERNLKTALGISLVLVFAYVGFELVRTGEGSTESFLDSNGKWILSTECEARFTERMTDQEKWWEQQVKQHREQMSTCESSIEACKAAQRKERKARGKGGSDNDNESSEGGAGDADCVDTADLTRRLGHALLGPDARFPTTEDQDAKDWLVEQAGQLARKLHDSTRRLTVLCKHIADSGTPIASSDNLCSGLQSLSLASSSSAPSDDSPASSDADNLFSDPLPAPEKRLAHAGKLIRDALEAVPSELWGEALASASQGLSEKQRAESAHSARSHAKEAAMDVISRLPAAVWDDISVDDLDNGDAASSADGEGPSGADRLAETGARVKAAAERLPPELWGQVYYDRKRPVARAAQTVSALVEKEVLEKLPPELWEEMYYKRSPGGLSVSSSASASSQDGDAGSGEDASSDEASKGSDEGAASVGGGGFDLSGTSGSDDGVGDGDSGAARGEGVSSDAGVDSDSGGDGGDDASSDAGGDSNSSGDAGGDTSSDGGGDSDAGSDSEDVGASLPSTALELEGVRGGEEGSNYGDGTDEYSTSSVEGHEDDVSSDGAGTDASDSDASAADTSFEGDEVGASEEGGGAGSEDGLESDGEQQEIGGEEEAGDVSGQSDGVDALPGLAWD